MRDRRAKTVEDTLNAAGVAASIGWSAVRVRSGVHNAYRDADLAMCAQKRARRDPRVPSASA